MARRHLHSRSVLRDIAHTSFPSACITSILRTYYTWVIVRSVDQSYNIARMAMWAMAELSIGVVISCLPVIPKFFQHMGPKLSSAFTLGSRSRKDSRNEWISTAPSDKVQATSKLKLTSIKHTFTSVFSNKELDTVKEDCHGLYDQQTLPSQDYVMLHEGTNVSRRDRLGELCQMPAARLATVRDDLENGYSRF